MKNLYSKSIQIAHYILYGRSFWASNSWISYTGTSCLISLIFQTMLTGVWWLSVSSRPLHRTRHTWLAHQRAGRQHSWHWIHLPTFWDQELQKYISLYQQQVCCRLSLKGRLRCPLLWFSSRKAQEKRQVIAGPLKSGPCFLRMHLTYLQARPR